MRCLSFLCCSSHVKQLHSDTSTDNGKSEVIKVKEKPALKSHNIATQIVTKHDPKRSLALFATYADNDNSELMGPEGFEQICDDAQIPMDGAMPLILSWQVGAEEMAKLTREAWAKSTDALKVSSLMQLNIVVRDLNELLVLGRPALAQPAGKSSKVSKVPYDRAKYWEYAKDPSAAFQNLYMYSFSLAKPQPSRSIDMETARALWSVLLVPRYPLMDMVLAFIVEKGIYRAANKDLWSMMLEFCRSVDTDLQGYDPDAAWPTLLDDFVAWKKGEPVT
ncbi:hypothetical protein AX15_004979 [Amanita polypyramis BW_CC]|nr:hypothetical protein AX15_004979 [Amanita polypyramis BW_CC]